MREYELTVVYDLTVQEAGGPEAGPQRLTTLIEGRGGKMLKVDHWGRRRMAYPINRAIDGDYIVSRVELEPGNVAALEAALKIDEKVYRHLVVRADELPPPPPPREPREPRPVPASADAPAATEAAPAAEAGTPAAAEAVEASTADAPAVEPVAEALAAEPVVEAPAAEPVAEAPAAEAAPEAPAAEPLVAEAAADEAPAAAEEAPEAPDEEPAAETPAAKE